MRSRSLHPQSIFDEEAVLNDFAKRNIPKINAKNLWRLIIQQNITDYHHIPDEKLSKAAKRCLDEGFTLCTSKIVKQTTSADMTTTKLLVRLQDGLHIESVIMRYGCGEMSNFPDEERDKRREISRKESGREYKSLERATLCVSSQVGCKMACTFCATGTMGLVSNLTSGEIIEQLYLANSIENIRNVVFMGMGEPLDNYDAVISSINAMVDQGRFSLSPSKISISTVGIVPRMLQLMTDAPKIGLALSLHAPNQTLRQQIVPTAKAYKIQKILEAADRFVKHQNESSTGTSRRRIVLVEYVLIAGVNDSEEVAEELGILLKGKNVLLNVLPYNETNVSYDYKRPDKTIANRFVAITRKHEVWTILRQTLGNDTSSACGQLVINQTCNSKGASNDHVKSHDVDLEDLASNGKSNAIKGVKGGYSRKRTMKSFDSSYDSAAPFRFYIALIVSSTALAGYFLWSRK